MRRSELLSSYAIAVALGEGFLSFEVLGYNIREGGQDRLPEIARVLRSQRADAVALLEATSRSNAERLARDLGMELAFGEANDGYHVAWLNGRPILRSENHRLAVLSKTLLEIEVAQEGHPLRLFATHLASRHDAQASEGEIQAILGILGGLRGEPHLLVGDFNSLGPDDPVGTPPPGVKRRREAKEVAPRPTIRKVVKSGYADCYRRLHPEDPGYTYPSGSPWLRLDYVFASPEMAARLLSCEVLAGGEAVGASDHLPIRATFR